MAEAILRRLFHERGAEATVHSAGLLSAGQPASALGARVLGASGMDLTSHRSRRLSTAMIDASDLVIGMTREHVREAVLRRPEAWGKSFTLKELVRRGEQAGARRPSEPLPSWLARVGAGRTTRDLIGWSDDDDVADPIGRPEGVYRRTAEELEVLLRRLVALLGLEAERSVASP